MESKTAQVSADKAADFECGRESGMERSSMNWSRSDSASRPPVAGSIFRLEKGDTQEDLALGTTRHCLLQSDDSGECAHEWSFVAFRSVWSKKGFDEYRINQASVRTWTATCAVPVGVKEPTSASGRLPDYSTIIGYRLLMANRGSRETNFHRVAIAAI